jgi:hypothetical protein
MRITFFANGMNMAFEDGEQVPDAQRPWIIVYAQYLASQGIDPTAQEIVMPDGSKVRIFSFEDDSGATAYNHETVSLEQIDSGPPGRDEFWGLSSLILSPMLDTDQPRPVSEGVAATELNPQLDDDVMLRIAHWKSMLRRRCINTGLEPDRIVHFILGQQIYVLANPIVARTPLYDEFDNLTGEFVTRRNFQSYWQPRIGVRWEDAPTDVRQRLGQQIPLQFRTERIVIDNPNPAGMLPVLRPDLGVRLNLDGSLESDGGNLHPLWEEWP